MHNNVALHYFIFFMNEAPNEGKIRFFLVLQSQSSVCFFFFRILFCAHFTLIFFRSLFLPVVCILHHEREDIVQLTRKGNAKGEVDSTDDMI